MATLQIEPEVSMFNIVAIYVLIEIYCGVLLIVGFCVKRFDTSDAVDGC